MSEWRKSSYSPTINSDCVELAALEGSGRGIRDSKNPEAPHLVVSRSALAALVQGIKDC